MLTSLLQAIINRQVRRYQHGDVDIKKDSIVEGISNLVAGQVPRFIADDHPTFVSFIEAYYEWMEEKGNAFSSNYLLKNYSDIDTTLEDFVVYFKNQYLKSFPKQLAKDSKGNHIVDESRLLKRIKDFYRAKGTEKSYKLLLRILQDVEMEFYYPRKDIMDVSGGKWIEEKSIKTTLVNGNDVFQIEDKTIYQKEAEGSRPTASAVVTRVELKSGQKYDSAELFLHEINGIFNTTDKIYCDIGGNTGEISENVFPLMTSLSFYNTGSKYNIGDSIEITSDYGFGAKAIINSIGASGDIKNYYFVDTGINYNENSTLGFNIKTISGTGAGITGHTGGVGLYGGYYFDTKGQLSTNKYLQDNYYYQEYSYEIKSEAALVDYKRAVLDLVHPAGTKLFGSVLINKIWGITTDYKVLGEAQELSTLGHYTPYNLGTTQNLRKNNAGIDLYPYGFNPENSQKAVAFVHFTGVPANNAGLTLTDTGNHEIHFKFNTGNTTVSGITYASGDRLSINVGINGAGDADAVAARFVSAVNNVTEFSQDGVTAGSHQYRLDITAQIGTGDHIVLLRQDNMGHGQRCDFGGKCADGGATQEGNTHIPEAGDSGNVIHLKGGGFSGGGQTIQENNEHGTTQHSPWGLRSPSQSGLVYSMLWGGTFGYGAVTAGSTYAYYNHGFNATGPGGSIVGPSAEGIILDPGVTGALWFGSNFVDVTGDGWTAGPLAEWSRTAASGQLGILTHLIG